MSQRHDGPRGEPQRLKQTRWHEYLLRFAFGGLITAVTGLIAHNYGPVVGGLFLAFPAILPASVTLIEKHSGKQPARHDSGGSAFGAAGLLAFGLVVWTGAGRLPPWAVLLLGLIAWLAVGIVLWIRWRHKAEG